jgi:hypothetical protein
MDVFVIAPFKQDLEALREEWNEWLDENRAAVKKIRKQAAKDEDELPITEGELVTSSLLSLAAELGKRDAVTTPNLASIMFLVEEGGKKVLMTGDGHWQDILKGLKAQNKLDQDGRLHVDVLKLQHHGSEHNIHEDFCKAVTADHYIICANGSHKNPDKRVLEMLIDSRIGDAASGPHANQEFKLWFNSSAKMAGTKKRAAHMREIEKFIRERAYKSGSPRKLRYSFLTQGAKQSIAI